VPAGSVDFKSGTVARLAPGGGRGGGAGRCDG